MTKSKRVFAVIVLLVIGLTAAMAYPPIIVAGVHGYLGYGSSDPDTLSTAISTSVDVDYRTALGQEGYLATWYLGNLWLIQGTLIDESDLGVNLGGPMGPVEIEFSVATEASSPLGDGQIEIAPRWSLSGSLSLTDSLGITTGYLGNARFQDSANGDTLHNQVTLGIAYDPSLALGVVGSLAAAMTAYPQQFVLDGFGNPTSESRQDRSGEAAVGLEGILGYFSLWTVDTSFGVVRSNANRYLDAVSQLDPQSQDKLSAELVAGISANPTSRSGLSVSLSALGTFFDQRDALDSLGIPTGELARSFRVSGTSDFDWSLTENVFVVAGLSGGFTLATDPGMSGWSLSGKLGLQTRF